MTPPAVAGGRIREDRRGLIPTSSAPALLAMEGGAMTAGQFQEDAEAIKLIGRLPAAIVQAVYSQWVPASVRHDLYRRLVDWAEPDDLVCHHGTDHRLCGDCMQATHERDHFMLADEL